MSLRPTELACPCRVSQTENPFAGKSIVIHQTLRFPIAINSLVKLLSRKSPLDNVGDWNLSLRRLIEAEVGVSPHKPIQRANFSNLSASLLIEDAIENVAIVADLTRDVFFYAETVCKQMSHATATDSRLELTL
jgi:hypothetical protein